MRCSHIRLIARHTRIYRTTFLLDNSFVGHMLSQHACCVTSLIRRFPLSDFYTGSPLDPDDLSFRDEFIEQLWEILKSEHVLLTAPRRTGKTSVMDHMAARPQGGFSTVTVFVQDLDHPAELLLTLLDAFQDRHPNLFRSVFQSSSHLIGKILGSVGEIEAGGFKVAFRKASPTWRDEWKTNGDDFFERVRKEKEPVLFIVDEFPDLVLNMEHDHPELVRPFLSWFRGHCVTPHPKQDPVRWLLGGSVNLSSTLDAIHCLDLINSLHDVALPVLNDQQVREFVRKMLSERQVPFAAEVPGAVAHRLGRPVPLFMQMITQDLYRMWKHEQRLIQSADVDTAFSELIVSSAARDKLQHYYSRIARYYDDPRRTAAYALLAKLSVTSDGLERGILQQEFDRIVHERGAALPEHDRKRLFNQLLRDLENDFYVAETAPGRYDFASGVLKAWWKKYYA